MDISSVNSDLLRGNATTIILTSLWSNDRYGYEILQEIDDKSQGQYKLKQATLYNQLKKLDKAGLISSYEGAPDDTGGGRRRYYSLTAEGRAFLLKEKSEYEYSRTILDKLVSDKEFDLSTDSAPFDTEALRPYTKTGEAEDKPKIVYKEKIVEKEVPVEIVKEVEVIKTVPVEVEVEKIVEKVVEKKIYLDADGNEITEEEAMRLADENRARAARASEAMKPAMTLEEMFARMDANSEYDKNNPDDYVVAPTPVAAEPAEHSYFSAYTGDNESRTRSESTLKEIFERLEQKEAEIDEKAKTEVATTVEGSEADAGEEQIAVHNDSDYAEAEIEKTNGRHIIPEDRGQFVTAAVIGKRDEEFEYEKEDVNYRAFFSSIVDVPEEKEVKTEKNRSDAYVDTDLKTRLYTEGFKIRPYDRGNTSEYYTFNFLQSNRINRDCWLLVLAMFVLEIGVMWVSLISRVSYVYFLTILLCGAALMFLPSIIYMLNPTKRIRASFNFKLSFINRGMIFIELTVVCILIGFFAVGASINDIDLILETMVLPMVLLTNLPVSSVVYYLLYRSRKYHIA